MPEKPAGWDEPDKLNQEWADRAEWTPGPWTTERANVGDKHPLFVVFNCDIAFRPPCDADAHLIAAAPDLYNALYNLLADVKLPLPANLVIPAELALLKARGEA